MHPHCMYLWWSSLLEEAPFVVEFMDLVVVFTYMLKLPLAISDLYCCICVVVASLEHCSLY